MPKYIKDISYIVPKDLVERMIALASNDRDKFLVALLYITGARPSEVCRNKEKYSLRGEDITFNADGSLDIKLTTLKRKKKTDTKFMIVERILKILPLMPFFDVVASYAKTHPSGPLLTISLRRVEQIVEKLSENKLCPYNFRHSRFTKMSRAGYDVSTLMYWKGAANIASVGEYLRAKRVEVERIE